MSRFCISRQKDTWEIEIKKEGDGKSKDENKQSYTVQYLSVIYKSFFNFLRLCRVHKIFICVRNGFPQLETKAANLP